MSAETLQIHADPSGSTLRIEHDPSDGRSYLTVTFDGHEAPFELTPHAATRIAGALLAYAAPVDLSGVWFTQPDAGAVQQATAAVKPGCP